MRLRSPMLGALVNLIVYGAANILVGEIGIGIGKIILYFVFLVAEGLIVDMTQPQWLSNLLNTLLLLF